VTFHQKGVIEGRERFLEMLDAFHAVIARRHTNMLEFLAEPRTIAEMVAHRFVYRPHVQMSFCDSIEGRTAELHVARMLERGEAVEVDPGRYRAA
jgi:hydroxyacylglutathione hydrolase